MSINVDAATNRVAGFNYDLNGNHTPAGTVYDIDNRMVQQARLSGGTNYYAYGASNNRIYKKTVVGAAQTHEVTLWGAFGERVGTYAVTASAVTKVRENFYFAGKLVATETSAGLRWILTDRLGSVRGVAATSNSLTETLDYYPYGEEKGSATAEDRDKFAMVHRDSDTGTDYAVNRFQQVGWGRFSSPDRYLRSGRLAKPSSWNRYTYVSGDPMNYVDPIGLDDCIWDPGTNTLTCSSGLGPRPGGPTAPDDPGVMDIPNDIFFLSASIKREVMAGFRNLIREGKWTDCQAVAGWAAVAQSAMVSAGGTAYDAITAFSELIPSGRDWMPETRGPLGNRGPSYATLARMMGIYGTGTDTLLPQGSSSGFQAEYQDTERRSDGTLFRNSREDQAHHFALFFMIGGRFSFLPSTVAGDVSGILDSPWENVGDFALGIEAFRLGQEFAKNPRMDIGGKITDRLCRKP